MVCMLGLHLLCLSVFSGDSVSFMKVYICYSDFVMCSFFLVWKRRLGSPAYTVFWHAQGILYTTHFCFSPSGSWNLLLISFISLPGLKATREECRLAVLQNWSGNLSKYGKVTTFMFFLLFFVYLLKSLLHKPSHGFSGVPIRYIHVFKSMLCSSSARCFLSHKALALSTKPFIMALFILSGWSDLFFKFMFVCW